jgi:hypothetical protein
VDIDPALDESPDEFKSRIIPELKSYDPPPSAAIDSGNGVQALWFLDEPIENDGPETIADAEARDYALAETFGADPSTRNIDRILRAPKLSPAPRTTPWLHRFSEMSGFPSSIIFNILCSRPCSGLHLDDPISPLPSARS